MVASLVSHFNADSGSLAISPYQPKYQFSLPTKSVLVFEVDTVHMHMYGQYLGRTEHQTSEGDIGSLL